MRRVFLTGASGFIGPHLVRALVTRGADVVALVRSTEAAAMLAALGADTIRGSLEGTTTLAPAFRDCDVVMHLAAPRHQLVRDGSRTGGRGPGAIVEMTRALLSALDRRTLPRLVLASSTAVYGHSEAMQDERAPTAASTPYGGARIAVEAVCRETFVDRPEQLVIARLTGVYGPGDVTRRHLFERIAAGQFRLIGDGRAMHHVSAVHDVVAALIACAEAPDARGRTLNIGSPPKTLRHFVETAAALLGTRIKATPALQPAAAAMLALLERSPTLRRRLPSLHATLDFQVRPRLYSLATAARCLPLPPAVPMRRAIAETLASYGLATSDDGLA